MTVCRYVCLFFLWLLPGFPVWQCADYDLPYGLFLVAPGTQRSFIPEAKSHDFWRQVQSFAFIVEKAKRRYDFALKIEVNSTFESHGTEKMTYGFEIKRGSIKAFGQEDEFLYYFGDNCGKNLRFSARNHSDLLPNMNDLAGFIFAFEVIFDSRNSKLNALAAYAYYGVGNVDKKRNVDLFGMNKSCEGRSGFMTGSINVSWTTTTTNSIIGAFLNEKYDRLRSFMSIDDLCPKSCTPATIAGNRYLLRDEFACRTKALMRKLHIWWHPDCPSTVTTPTAAFPFTRHYIVTFRSEVFPNIEINCPITMESKPKWYIYKGYEKGYTRLSSAVVVDKILLFRVPHTENDTVLEDKKAILHHVVALRCNSSDKAKKDVHEVAVWKAPQSVISCNIDEIAEVYLDEITSVHFRCNVSADRFWPIVWNRPIRFDVKAHYSVTPSTRRMTDSVFLEFNVTTLMANQTTSRTKLRGTLAIDPVRLANMKHFRCDELVVASCRPPLIFAMVELFLKADENYNDVPVVQFRHLDTLKLKVLPHKRYHSDGVNRCQADQCYPLGSNDGCRPIGSKLEWAKCPRLGTVPKATFDASDYFRERMIIPSNFGFAERIAVPCLAGTGRTVEWKRYNAKSKVFEALPNGISSYGQDTNEEMGLTYQYAVVLWSEAVSQTFRCEYYPSTLGHSESNEVYIFYTAMFLKICSFDLVDSSDRYNAKAVVTCSLTKEGTQLFLDYRDTVGFPIDLSEYTFDPPFVADPNVTTSSAIYEYRQLLEINISINIQKAKWKPKVFETYGLFSLLLHFDDDVHVEPIEPFPVRLVYFASIGSRARQHECTFFIGVAVSSFNRLIIENSRVS